MNINLEDIRIVFENSLSHSIIESPISKKKFVDYSKRREGLAIVVDMLDNAKLPEPKQVRTFDISQIQTLTRTLSRNYFALPIKAESLYLS